MTTLAVVVAPRNRGWILERIGREVCEAWPGRADIVYGDGTSIPAADRYFFTHWSLAFAAAQQSGARARRSLVFFTHPPPHLWRSLGFLRQLRPFSVASMSSHHARALGRLGQPRSRLHVVLPGSEPGRFLPHDRGDGVIGLNSSYYPRKAPERIAQLVATMGADRFVLVGRNWEEWEGFPDLVARPNFEYVDTSFDEYAAQYARMDVFVSLSSMEGGPIPLLEAMLSNAVPVVTDTGIARDVIEHGVNGFVIPRRGSVTPVVAAIRSAQATSTDIRSTIEHLTWARFGNAIAELMN